tara:strand:+ start:1089 stop:1487 length:399 start_codon:yes stop_codon:yes gene_type:complete
MTNQTQAYIQMELNLAQSEVDPYGIDLKLEGVMHNTIRVADTGVKAIKDRSINSRRSKQVSEGVHVSKQEYKYPVLDPDGNIVVDDSGKKQYTLMQYGTIKRIDRKFAEALTNRLLKQSDGLRNKVREMTET